MTLIIDISKKSSLILGDNKYSWNGLYNLDESLLLKIDKFLKKNKIKLENIKKIKIIPSKESIVSTRIAKAMALALVI